MKQFKNNVITLPDGQEVYVRATFQSLGVAVLGNVLNAPECKALIELARGNLSRSQLEGDTEDDGRTSSGTFLDYGSGDAILKTVRKRFAAIAQRSPRSMEDLQILRYTKGQEYKPHFDFFNVKTAAGRKIIEDGGQRVATLVVYLADVPTGGATVFPKLGGFQVRPNLGDAVYFEYPNKELLSLHGGTPVMGSGVKWTATQWWRD